jgi:hypothetical protein
MAATMKQTCESTNNKTTQPIGGFLPFFISVSLGVCMGVPRLQRHKELGIARLGAHPMAVTVKQSRW